MKLSQQTAIRPRQATRTRVKKARPKSSEAVATSQSADEDAPVETSTDYTFGGAVFVHRLTGCTDWFLYGQPGLAGCHG